MRRLALRGFIGHKAKSYNTLRHACPHDLATCPLLGVHLNRPQPGGQIGVHAIALAIVTDSHRRLPPRTSQHVRPCEVRQKNSCDLARFAELVDGPGGAWPMATGVVMDADHAPWIHPRPEEFEAFCDRFVEIAVD